MENFIDYYDILDIDSNASEEQIKKAYRQKAIKYHPDKNLGEISFTKKFIEVKEAYDILLDIQKRIEFDIRYRARYSNFNDQSNNGTRETKIDNDSKRQDEYERQKRNERQREEETNFRYDPYKQFYSDFHRELQDTPQFNPIYDFWGNSIPDNLEFFKLPNRIGKIICGFSDLKKGAQPLTSERKAIRILVGLFMGLIFGCIVYFLARLTNPIWICFWFIVPSIIAMLVKHFRSKYRHHNLFVGVNGFAEFTCEDSRENFTISNEINFNDISDLFVYHVDHSHNLAYQKTTYIYSWINREKGKVVYVSEGDFNKKDEISGQPIHLHFYKTTEKYWTVYLLDRLEESIQKHGFILFNLYSHKDNGFQEYIKLGIGKITFIKSGKTEFTYKFNEIKKIYMKGSELRIQHLNFEKTLFFFKSGNEDVIPMANLCNRQYFLKAIEVLLGYSLE